MNELKRVYDPDEVTITIGGHTIEGVSDIEFTQGGQGQVEASKAPLAFKYVIFKICMMLVGMVNFCHNKGWITTWVEKE